MSSSLAKCINISIDHTNPNPNPKLNRSQASLHLYRCWIVKHLIHSNCYCSEEGPWLNMACLTECVLCSSEPTVAQGSARVSDRTVSHCWPVHCTELWASDQRRWLAHGLFVMVVCRWVAGAPLCTRQPSRWMLGQRRPRGWKSHQAAVPGPCTEKMKHTVSPGDTGQTLTYLLHPLLWTPIPSCPSCFPHFILLFPLFPFTGEDCEPNQPEYGVWPSGVCGPRLLNKGADWLIDRPSPVPAPHMFPGSLPYIRILCWAGLC